MVKEWQHNTKMILVPNPHYYGNHTRLTEVDMIFALDAHNAFQAYQGGQYSFIWSILPSDMNAARGLSGFVSQTQLQTDAIFFNTQTPPFNQLEVRQAFAQSIDKTALAQSILFNSAVPALTIIPAGIPGYQPNLKALAYNHSQALAALRKAYSDISKLSPITFSYPNTLVMPGSGRISSMISLSSRPNRPLGPRVWTTMARRSKLPSAMLACCLSTTRTSRQ
jgi:ABC-type oligopeptide transport system substrate-binding subunit